MNKPVSAQPMAAVTALRKPAVGPPSTPSSVDPPRGDVKARPDSVTISDAARMQQSQQGNSAQANLLSTASGSASMTKAERMMADLKASFMTKAGDDGFDAKLDFNQDGMINAGDLGMFREKMMANGLIESPAADDSPAPVTTDTIRDSFFKSAGEDGFNAAADLNGDGVVNAGDLAMLRQSQESSGDSPQPVPFEVTGVGADSGSVASTTGASAVDVEPVTAPPVDAAPLSVGSEATVGVGTQTAVNSTTGPAIEAADPATTRQNLLDALRDAFFSRAGDDRFNAALDSNGDGRLNVADFLSIRDRV